MTVPDTYNSNKPTDMSAKDNSMGFSPEILRLVGSALPKDGKVEDIEDDRLEYLLSK